MEIYGRIRRTVLVEGRSQHEAAREFGISRKAIQKLRLLRRAISAAATGEAAQAGAIAGRNRRHVKRDDHRCDMTSCPRHA